MEQVALMSWCEKMSSRHPQLALIFSIPNGGKRSSGWWEKAEGLKRGVPDLFLPVCVKYHDPEDMRYGLFIEMKFGKNKCTKFQKAWHEALKDEGYEVQVCYGFEEARDVIVEYLGLEVR
jgi:hypothetical protein